PAIACKCKWKFHNASIRYQINNVTALLAEYVISKLDLISYAILTKQRIHTNQNIRFPEIKENADSDLPRM
ncbi:hypothetical protein OFC10_31960, partial [Escherichia coli]|nr:hypothetical protein [Escherichia coli]